MKLIQVYGITFGRSLNCGWVEPPLLKTAGRCVQADKDATKRRKRKKKPKTQKQGKYFFLIVIF